MILHMINVYKQLQSLSYKQFTNKRNYKAILYICNISKDVSFEIFEAS